MPTCWIIAGPNGAGKTTFAMEYLPQVAQCSRFINADLIAAGLSPLAHGGHSIPSADIERRFARSPNTPVSDTTDMVRPLFDPLALHA
jgi:predicted ABC-type ATPase